MKPIDVIIELNNTKASKEKEKVLEKAWNNNCFDFFSGVQKGFDPFDSLFLTKIPYITEIDDEPDDLNTNKIIALYNQLAMHSITGQAAEMAVENALNISGVEIWNKWYRRILLKDFQKTVTLAQINRVLNRFGKKDARAMQYIIPTIGLQKHTVYQGTMLAGNAYVDSFTNGTRQAIILNTESKTVLTFNENGKKVKSDKRWQSIVDHLPFGIMFDGVKTSSNTYIYDLIPLDEYKKGYTTRTQEERHTALCELQDLLYEVFKGSVSILPKMKVDLLNTESFHKSLEDFKAQGISQIMIKDLMAPYLSRKSPNWIKYNLDNDT